LTIVVANLELELVKRRRVTETWNTTTMNVPFLDTDAAAWFASEPQWRHRVGDGWKGVKILGNGSQGVAGRNL
jgi:hypothetical protein